MKENTNKVGKTEEIVYSGDGCFGFALKLVLT